MTDPGKTQRISVEALRELIRQSKELGDGSQPRLEVAAVVTDNPGSRPSLELQLSVPIETDPVQTIPSGDGSQKEGEA
jgi:hypothetical protein